MTAAIETRKLTKEFQPPQGWRRVAKWRPITAVRDVSLTVLHGELFGLLGPNGAGKTTLVKMLCTLISPTSGEAIVAGHPLQDDAAIRAAVGLVVADERSFYWRLTGRQNLEFFAAMYHLFGAAAARRVEAVLDQVEMAPWADLRLSDYSSGMKQRIAIARSLLHEPRILFLDEPSRSLDPTATDRLHQLLRRLVTQQGVTVFLITHDLAEAEKLCGRVAIMHQGEIRAIDEPGALRSSLDQRVSYTVHVGGLSLAAEKAVRAVTPGVSVEVSGPLTQLGFRTTDDETELTEVLGCLLQYGATIHRIDGSPLPLDQVFRQLTSDAIDEETD